MTTTTKQAHQIVASSWRQTDREFYTSNDVIEAYIIGKREGLNSERRALLDRLNDNLLVAGNATHEIFEFISSRKMNFDDAYLKIEAWDTLSIIVLVKEEDYIKEDFNSVYEVVSTIEDKFNKEYTNLFFSFIADSGNLDIEHLQSDGFIFVYSKDGK